MVVESNDRCSPEKTFDIRPYVRGTFRLVVFSLYRVSLKRISFKETLDPVT